jgi:hypothetical protein
VGGWNDHTNCVRAAPAASARLDTSTDGRTVDTVTDRGDLCAAGWEAVGWPDLDAVTCVHPDGGPVTYLQSTADGRAFRDLDEPAEVCPAGWDYVGARQEKGACHAASGTTTTLGGSVDGRTVADVEDNAEICPDGWSFLGMSIPNAVQCATSRVMSTAYLEASSDGTTYDENPATAAEICPAGWDVLGFLGPIVACGG